MERILTSVPGPRSRAYAQRLRACESRGVTYLAEDFPVFWRSAAGASVTDVDGNVYLDLTSAFGVAAVGHGNPAVARAIAEQAQRLTHGMGDVHPSDVRTELVERLAGLAPVENGKVFLCSSGAEAVEFALKTAMLATGKPDLLAFEGGYHGLSYGALEIAGNPTFRAPWKSQLRDTTSFVAFPSADRGDSAEDALTHVESALRGKHSIGAIVIEPIQGRAGVVVPPEGFLRGVQSLCRQYGALFVLDEIFTGFGRTGGMFAAQRERLRPDLICLGKALGGGFPISAAVGSGEIMNAWPRSRGEALHTSTYLGNPMGCAAALAVLDEIERLGLARRARSIGDTIGERLRALIGLPHVRQARGRGALWALELRDGELAKSIVVRALARGLILLQAGLRGEAIQLAPPLIITEEQLERSLDILTTIVGETENA